MTNNVILFPGFKRESPPQTIEEIADKVTQTRKDHVDMIMIDLNLFSDSIMNHKKPVLLINTQLHSALCVEIRMDGGNCISLPFTRDELISVVESLNQQIK